MISILHNIILKVLTFREFFYCKCSQNVRINIRYTNLGIQKLNLRTHFYQVVK